MESKLRSASNKIPSEQCTQGVEGEEKELINDTEDKNCNFFQWRMIALTEDNCAHLQ